MEYKRNWWQPIPHVLAAEIQRCTKAIVPDVIMVQEHHLDGDKIDKIGNICPGSWTNTWSAAAGDRQIHGGVLTAMKAKYNASFTGRGCLVEGRVVYIRIKHSYGHLGILNMYAPNLVAEKKAFWLQLLNKKPDAELWIIGGNFNIVEQQEDRSRNAIGTVQGVEKDAWDKFCLAYNVIDCWNAPNFLIQKEKSLLYCRVGGSVHGRTMSKLDRWYLDPRLIDRKGKCIIFP